MTKKDMVLNYLKKHKKITPMDALRECGSMRLSAIIFDLKKNYKIKTKLIDVPTRFGNATVAEYQYLGAIK